MQVNHDWQETQVNKVNHNRKGTQGLQVNILSERTEMDQDEFIQKKKERYKRSIQALCLQEGVSLTQGVLFVIDHCAESVAQQQWLAHCYYKQLLYYLNDERHRQLTAPTYYVTTKDVTINVINDEENKTIKVSS